MEQFVGILGIFSLLGIAVAMSNNRKSIPWRLVIWGLGLQLLFAVFILKTPIGQPFFGVVDTAIKKLLSFSDAGSDFLFKSFGAGIVEEPLMNFAFRILPTLIFFSSLITVLYYLGIMQFIVKWIARAMQKTMRTSGSETLSVSANIFVGQTEAPLMIRPFVSKMTRSELMAVMVGGFATVAGGIMAIYVKMLEDIPGIAGHMMAASIMSAPAALVIAKIIYPETESSDTMGDLNIAIEKKDDNVMEALSRGATTGMKLAANVGAMLVAFVAMIALVNAILGLMDLSLQQILGWIFSPLAWTMGVPWSDAGTIGALMGEKLVLTELIAYGDLAELRHTNSISDRSAIIASYALCGFANFASIGIQLGGIGGIAPERRKDLAKMGLKAMFGGALASWLTATVAGILI
ncbi:MAG: nucleoside transporter C-terminal domain-containing protein [Candidatus Marinimicrobia bacterium]|jgi:CNT family concentrative nucleoside transporter|nr:nucleoside transporter C-terminal domain-containing protein [Candidatus Neomarinimicrobiota bacterium]MDP6612344.1 nucleoside transporter C-terminal domain-containing protein [Candidatus Neomarinimicrobiota bacterium]|tara:strand:- start:27536 stop:28753 length:1218 start_codon:yes stop_codon:yes gene_type:complete